MPNIDRNSYYCQMRLLDAMRPAAGQALATAAGGHRLAGWERSTGFWHHAPGLGQAIPGRNLLGYCLCRQAGVELSTHGGTLRLWGEDKPCPRATP